MTRVRDEKCDLGKDLGEKNKTHGFEKFRMGILPFDPLFVYIAIIYGFTRLVGDCSIPLTLNGDKIFLF